MSPFRGFIDGLLDEIVCSAGELSQYHWSESMISDDNHDDDDAEGILHLSRSAVVQFDSARELVVVSTRYFHEDRVSLDTGVVSIARADQVNGTSVNLHEKRHQIELTPMIPLRSPDRIPNTRRVPDFVRQ
ncbi:unnamed protein product [Macrosiphum euphorbiae]|uniref:Uncharacterized protein n=1 Tax=Macrosiphum euphorbiae TaxID=13131 RepID=A0AAV0VIS5_9HEMI|nr:unnamed protein product [Macrosiphum euphorbiae]